MKETFFWAIPDLLAGSAMPAIDELQWIRAQGIRAMFSLHDPGKALARAIRHRGFDHHIRPLPDNIPPTKADLKAYQQAIPWLVKLLANRVEEEIPTLIHCMAGKDRTGLVLALFLSRWWGGGEQLSADETIAKMLSINPRLLSADGYEAAARRLIGD
jgi:hypothetical protein